MRDKLIFDLDGTLVDSCAICCAILNDMLADRGSTRRVSDALARPWISYGGIKMMTALLGPECGDPDLELAEFRRRYAARKTPIGSLFPHVASGLTQLHAEGFHLAICSNKPQNLVEKVLEDTGLIELFSSVIGSSARHRPKPATDMLDAVLEQLSASPSRALFIGDSEVDDAVAREASVRFLFLTHGYAHSDYAPPAHASYPCFETLTAALLNGSTIYDSDSTSSKRKSRSSASNLAASYA